MPFDGLSDLPLDTVVVAVIVMAAIGYSARRAYRQVQVMRARKTNGGCDGCGH